MEGSEYEMGRERCTVGCPRPFQRIRLPNLALAHVGSPLDRL